jgi:hypothetical protein
MDELPATLQWSPTSVVQMARRQLSSLLFKKTASPIPFLWSQRTFQPHQSFPSPSTATTSTSINIHSLPTELLDMVFYHYTHTLATLPYSDASLESIRMSRCDPFRQCVGVDLDATTNPVTLTHVCARWRSLARLTSKLWSRISVRRPQAHNIPMLAVWLQRSGRKPLDLTIIQDSNDVNTRNTSAIRDIFYLILNQCHRWRSLTLQLYADTGPLFLSIYEHRRWNGLSLLEGVEIHTLEDWTARESEALCSFLYSSPKLQRLTFGNLREVPELLWAAPLAQVTHLDLDRLRADQLHVLLSSSPSLANLSIETLAAAERPEFSKVHHASLQTLSLNRIHYDMTEVLGHLALPSLTKLCLRTGFGPCCEPSRGWKSLADCLKRSSCHLLALEIWLPDGAEELLIDIMASPYISQLSGLTVWSTTTDSTLAALMDTGPTRVLPNLAALSLQLAVAADGAISRVVSTRMGTLRYMHAVLGCSSPRDAALIVSGTTLDFEISHYQDATACCLLL